MKRFIRTTISVVLVTVILMTCACSGKKAENSPPPTATPEPSMQQILDSLGSVEFTDAKNVILFIGDGMGKNHINATKAIIGGQYNEKLAIEYLTNQGEAVTTCVEGEPDSASGGTALATGYKSRRSYLGMNSYGKKIKNMCELMASVGKKSGIVTNENITDATPAAFVVHTTDRMDANDIVKQQIDNCPDLIMGGGLKTYETALKKDSSYNQKIADNGITWAKTWDEVQKFENGKLIATLTDGYFEDVENASPSLAQMTEKAIELLSDDEDGFFLMVEGGVMDESAHSSDVMDTCKQMISFDEAVCVGIRYATAHPDTIVIVTADHNTGGLMETEEANKSVDANSKTDTHVKSLIKNEKSIQKKNPDIVLADLPYRFTTIAHTSDPVQVFAIGKGTEVLNGTSLRSCELGQFIGKVLSGEDFGQVKKK